VRVVVLQKIAALYAQVALAAPCAQAPAVDAVVARVLALQLAAAKPAPARFVGQVHELGAQQLVLVVEREPAHGAPAYAGHAVVDVVHAEARAGVGGDTRAEHIFLQRRFAHLRDHGRGPWVGRRGVEQQKHGVVIAARGQALLGIEHLRLGVEAARGQACDAARAFRVVALAAFDAQGAEEIRGAGVVEHAQRRFVAVGVYVGAAALYARGGVAARLQLVQALFFRGVPAGLREGLAGRELPASLHAL